MGARWTGESARSNGNSRCMRCSRGNSAKVFFAREWGGSTGPAKSTFANDTPQE